MAETFKTTREKLYNEIWEISPSQVARKYNISYQKLKKACEGTNIPLPPADYWTNIKKGITQPIPPLPPFDEQNLEFPHIATRFKESFSSYSSRHIPFLVLWALETFTDENNCITANEIIQRIYDRYYYKITRSTVYSAIATLKKMHYKINDYEENDHQGYNLERGIKPAYIKLINESLTLNPLIPEDKERSISNQINKFMARNNKVCNRRSITTDIIKNTKYNPHFYMAVEAIDMAMIQNLKIEFDYMKMDTNGNLVAAANSHFKLTPAKIHLEDNRYFLRCLSPDRNGTILFRIDRMHNVLVTEEECENLPPTIHPQVFADDFLNAYNDRTTVTFKCDNSLLEPAADFFGKRFSEIKIKDNNDDKTFSVTGRISYQKALEWAMSHVDKAIVTEPQRLYADVCEKLKNNLYNK